MKEKRSKAGREGILWPVILAYLSSLLLVVLAALLALHTTVGSAGYMKSRVVKSDYAESMYVSLWQDFVSYGAATGFSESTMTCALSIEKIEADMNDAVQRIYDGNLGYHIHDEVAETTFAAMEAEAQSRGITVEGDVREGVEIVAEAVRQQYAGAVSIPLYTQLYTLIEKLEMVTWIGVIVSAIFTAASLFLLVRICRHDPRLGVSCLGYALLGAALVCLVLGLAVPALLPLEALNVQPLAFKNLIISYVRGIFGRFNIFAAVYAVVAVVLVCLINSHSRRSARPAH